MKVIYENTITLNKDDDDENFLKELLKNFYRQIMIMENYNNFKNILIEWLKDFFEQNKKDFDKILELMKNHEENENWFSSLLGFCFEHDITGTNIVDKDIS